jgi:hypothetical protein
MLQQVIRISNLNIQFFPSNGVLRGTVYSGMMTHSIRLAILFAVLSMVSIRARAQVQQGAPALPLGGSEGTLAFERSELTFAPQSAGIENCINIAINNTTDHPRLLTQFKSLDPKHFFVTSPAQEMLPLTVGPNTTFYLNLCFKADKAETYESTLLAIFQSDTVRLKLSGRGLAPPEVMPLPTETALTDIRHKKHQWTFQFGLKTRGTVHLTLEDIDGKVVRNFPFDALKTPGYYEVTFDERSDAGKKLPAGSYVLRLEVADGQSKTTVHSSKLVKIS